MVDVIPTMILVGLVLGLLLRPGRRALLVGAAAVLVASIGWGLVVDEVLAGTALAGANIAAGLLVGVALQRVARAVLHHAAPT